MNTDPNTTTIPQHSLVHSLSRAELDEWVRTAGQPAYRARQIWDWLYVRRVKDWAAMTNLSTPFRSQLAASFSLTPAEPAEVQGEPADTRKILARLQDGERVECVLIPAEKRRTVCVSSQAGCRYHCAFCASGQAGFHRNLAAGEIIGQVLLASDLWQQAPSHVVFMGIGEPFDNYEAVLKAIQILNDPDGFNIGARRLTLSTCGLVPGIQRLAGEGLQVELSVSLHAPNNTLRDRLMPVNQKYPLPGLLAACDAYSKETGRIVTFEYTLIRDLNDTPACARELATLLRGRLARVNLIPLSPVPEFPHASPRPDTAERFMAVLEQVGINATLRQSRGCTLDAACGQLRYRPTPGPA